MKKVGEKMKKVLIFGGVILAIAALVAFNKITSKNKVTNAFAEVERGAFEISVSNSGELIAEKSVDIKGPQIGQTNQQQQGGGGQGNRGGGGGGMDMRRVELKIQDIVPEGTIVKEGDYIAQLDRSSYTNSLQDARNNYTTVRNSMDMKILDTAVTLTSLRDDIKNQKYTVEEAKITLAQSKFEPPATIRQAEITLDKATRSLEQKQKTYELRVAQTLADIRREQIRVNRAENLVNDLTEYLAKFTITAPGDGMVIYKKEFNGAKRKAGSSLNAFDLVIATLPDLSSMISKTFVNEIEISKIKPGQKVNIKVDAFPNKAFNGTVISLANIGEVLPNSDSKMFEVLIKLDQSDPSLRPSMTTDNKIIIKSFDDVLFIPTECVNTGTDSIPFVYEKNHTKHVVLLGEANEKFVIVQQGVKEGESLYLATPAEPENFRLVGEELISTYKGKK
jgi:HlyD family secretion protein